jgi:hypothetical protein
MNMSGNNFELELAPSRDCETTIKWKVGQDKYEIHVAVLTRTDLRQLVQYCLLVMHKINQEVGSDARVHYLLYLTTVSTTL